MPRAADDATPSQQLAAEDEEATRPQEPQSRWTALSASFTSHGASAGQEGGSPARPRCGSGGAARRALLLAALACCTIIAATLFAHRVWTGAARHDGGSAGPSPQHSHDRPVPPPPLPPAPPPDPPPAPPPPGGFERRSTLPALGSQGCHLAQPTSWYALPTYGSAHTLIAAYQYHTVFLDCLGGHRPALRRTTSW